MRSSCFVLSPCILSSNLLSFIQQPILFPFKKRKKRVQYKVKKNYVCCREGSKYISLSLFKFIGKLLSDRLSILISRIPRPICYLLFNPSPLSLLKQDLIRLNLEKWDRDRLRPMAKWHLMSIVIWKIHLSERNLQTDLQYTKKWENINIKLVISGNLLVSQLLHSLTKAI